MESVPRNVIIDLLPTYLAGEASDETRVLVEEYARNDPQIARLIRAGTAGLAETRSVTVPQEVELKALKRMRSSIRRQMLLVAAGTAALLLVPLIAMQFTAEVDWSLFDFVFMGALLFGSGLIFVLVTRSTKSVAYKLATGLAVLTSFLVIWINLAVGIIGSEDNPANGLYLGVLIVEGVGALIALFRASRMVYAMFATAFAMFLVPIIAMLIWRPSLENPLGILGVLVLNGVLSAMFAGSALLYRRACSANVTN